MTKGGKANKRVISSILLMFFVLTVVFIPGSARAIIKAPINLMTSTAKTQLMLNEDFIVNYTIQPQNIPYTSVDIDYAKDREIVLVLDTSGSMEEKIRISNNGHSEDKKINVLKQTAINFVRKFSGDKRVNISIVKYSTSARVLNLNNNAGTLLNDSEVNAKAFINMESSSSLSNIEANINKLQANGGTNIGDGLRRAYHLLNSSSKSNARKYVILMTDGVPTAVTYNSISYEWWDIFHSNPIMVYNTGEGNAQDNKIYVNNGDDDYKGFSLGYANTIASMIKNSRTMNSTMIAFSNQSDPTKLAQIAQNAGGDYKVATSKEDMDSVYENIAGQVNSDLPIGAVNFNAAFPSGIVPKAIGEQINLPKGFQVSGQTVTGSLNNINYRKDDTKKAYVADPISFTIKLKAAVKGAYVLGQNNSIYLTYKDIDGNITTNYFPALNINVYTTTPPNITATLTNKPGTTDVYNLTVNSGSNIQNDTVLWEISNTDPDPAKSAKSWTYDGRKNNTTQYTFEINKSDLAQNNLYIRATDKSSPANVVYETVPVIQLSSPELREEEHSNNQRLVNLNMQTENNSTITGIEINGTELVNNSSPLVTNNGSYKYLDAVLNDGENIITIGVRNQYNNTANITFTENVDALSPIITANFNDSGLRINTTFNEDINRAWFQYDLNGDAVISENERVTLTTTTKREITNFSIPNEFYDKVLTIKAKDISGNIGSYVLRPDIKSELIKHGMFAKQLVGEDTNNGENNGKNYIVDNNGTVSNANNVLTKLGVLVKLKKSTSQVTITINKHNSNLNGGSISNVSATLYKINDDNSLQLITDGINAQTNGNQKKITVAVPLNQFEAGKNYLITYTLKPNVSKEFLTNSGIEITNSVTVDGITSDLRLINMPLPDIE